MRMVLLRNCSVTVVYSKPLRVLFNRVSQIIIFAHVIRNIYSNEHTLNLTLHHNKFIENS